MGSCKYCGTQFEDTYAFCPNCGRPVHTQASDSNGSRQIRAKALLPVILLAVVLCGVGLAAFLHRNNAADATRPSTEESVDTALSTVTLTFLRGGAQEGSMKPLTYSVGETVALPSCGFIREGYKFDCWEDDTGHLCAPGDQIVVERDMTFSAVWTTADAASGNTSVENETEESDSDPSKSFPKNWSGSFEAYSQHVTGGTYNTSVKLALSSIESDGHLAGTCYIGYEDPQERTGSYHVEGHVDWDTGKITLVGTSWEDQGDLEYMRSFDGAVDSNHASITGTSQRNDGSHKGNWSMHAD